MGIASMSLRQETLPDHLLGCLTSAFWTTIAVPCPAGAALATAPAAHLGAPVVLSLMGMAVIVLAARALVTPLRMRHSAYGAADGASVIAVEVA